MLQLANTSSKPLECIVCQRISVQKLVLISCKVAKTYAWMFLIGGFHMRLICVRDGWAQWHVKIHRGELVGSFTVNNERAFCTWKPSSEQKKCFERIPSRPDFACKFADWVSSIFQSLQMHCCTLCNLADNSSVKTNQEIMIFMAEKKASHM